MYCCWACMPITSTLLLVARVVSAISHCRLPAPNCTVEVAASSVVQLQKQESTLLGLAVHWRPVIAEGAIPGSGAVPPPPPVEVPVPPLPEPPAPDPPRPPV